MLLFICCSVQTAGRNGEGPTAPGRIKQCSANLYNQFVMHNYLTFTTIRKKCIANCLHGREAMMAALQAGTTLVVARYSYSGVVFTAAKHLPGLDLTWCKVKPGAFAPPPPQIRCTRHGCHDIALKLT